MSQRWRSSQNSRLRTSDLSRGTGFEEDSSSDVATTLARSRLGVWSVVGFALCAAAPLMVVGGVVTTGWAVTQTVAFGLAFLIMAALLALFSVGLVSAARHVTNSGAFYTYLARGLSRRLAVGGSAVALVAYNLLQIGLYGIFGPTAAALVMARSGLDLPWWVYSLLAWASVSLLGILRVKVNSAILSVLLTAEILIVVLFDLLSLTHPAAGHLDFAVFNPKLLSGGALGAVLVTVTTAYVGFEGGPVYSEESKDPRRTVPAATYLSLALMAVLYAGTTWAMAVAVGSDQIIPAAQEQGPNLIFNLAARHLGGNGGVLDAGQFLLLSSIFAGMLSYHNAVARYSFALGRERVLPAAFGRTNPASGAPLVGSVVQSCLGLLAIIACAVTGADPLATLFFRLGVTGGLGVLILLLATSFAVVGFFWRDRRGESRWHRIVAPLSAGVGLSLVLYLAVANYAALLGVSEDSPLRWALPSGYAVAIIAGTGYGHYLCRSKPAVFARIGLGANAITGRTTPVLVRPENSTAGGAN